MGCTPLPHSVPSLGRQAGQLGDVTESQRKRFFPEGATRRSHRRCKNTSQLPNCSERSLSRQASDHPPLPPALAAAQDAAPSADEISSRKHLPASQPWAGRADTHTPRLAAQSIPLACAAEQMTSKCLPLRRGEEGKPWFIPGSAHTLQKAAAPFKNTTACKLSN